MIGSQIEDIVIDDPPGDTKSMYDMVFDEANNIGSFNFDEPYNFRTLWEVIGYSEDEPMTSS